MSQTFTKLSQIHFLKLLFILVSLSFCLIFLNGQYANAQGNSGNDGVQAKTLPFTIVKLDSAPITITDFQAKLISDSFDVNQAIQLYLSYENCGKVPISAIQIRFVLQDNGNNIVRSFLGSDNSYVAPYQTGSQKWQFQGMIKNCARLQVLLLQVKYADGNTWRSNLE